MSGPAWVVDDYRTPAGSRPVKDFLDGLSKTARPKVYAVLAMLEARGNHLAMPQSKAMGDGLHELRIAHPDGPFRLLYCFRPGRRIILLHGFVKRTEETPQGAIALARGRLKVLPRKM
jgi:phage-related protein